MDFSQIALFLAVAAVFALIAKLTRQPLIIGYIFAGIIIGIFAKDVNLDSYRNLGQIGVTLLLFLLGMEMNIHEILGFGKVVLITSLSEILISFGLGYIISILLGYPLLPAIFISIALCFSSTIIVISLLSGKKELSSLYGKITVGILLFQDFVAIIILSILTNFHNSGFLVGNIVFLMIKSLVLIFLILLISRKLIPYLFDKYFSIPQELLFISSMAWALGFSVLLSKTLGFSYEIGGFIAGLSLSNLPEQLQISSKIRPLKDFFLIMFFLLLGSEVANSNVINLLPPAVILSIFVLIGHPIIIFGILGLLGYKRRTFFGCGIALSQVSEFSFILMSVAFSLGYVSRDQMLLIVLVGLITMTVSTYMILGNYRLFSILKEALKFFEKNITKENVLIKEEDYSGHIILIGCDKTGMVISKYLIRKGKRFVVIDFNPKVFNALTALGIPVIFGDTSDPDILESAGVRKSKLIISTIGKISENLYLLDYLKTNVISVETLFTIQSKIDALKLYEKGASYVVVSDLVSGEHIKHILSKHTFAKNKLISFGKNQFKKLFTA